MVDFGAGSGRDRWTCPNDRQLALRAKLRTGWSVKTQTLQSFAGRGEAALDEREREIILEVIRRAETLEHTEQQRVGRLVQRLESMKTTALGNGTSRCVLCGDSFGLLGATGAPCKDCKKVACQKCGVGSPGSGGSGNSGARGETAGVWLCKICAETREMWKKSGAWFFKGLPKYVLPEQKTPSYLRRAELGGTDRPARPTPLSRPPAVTAPVSPLVGRRVSCAEEEESSSEDDQLGASRRRKSSGKTTPGTPSTPAGNRMGFMQHKNSRASLASIESYIIPNSVFQNGSPAARGSPPTLAPVQRGSPPYQGGPVSPHSPLQRDTSPCSVVTPPATLPPTPGQGGQRSSFADTESDRSSTGSLKGLLRRDTSGAGNDAHSNESGSTRGEPLGVRWADCDSVCTGDTADSILVPSQAFVFGSVNRRGSSISGCSSGAVSLQYGGPAVEEGVQLRGGDSLRDCQRDSLSSHRDSVSSQHSSQRGSISIQSDQLTDDDIPEEAYLGSMEYSVTYDPQTSMLHCNLHRAKGLRSMDINGLCDPYCRAQLLPAAGGKSCSPLRSRTVHKTREPEFNETLAWCHVTETDHVRKTLHLVVFDEDRYGDEALGSSRLHLSRLSPGHTSHFNVFLEKPYQDEVCEEDCGNPGRGRILLSLCYSSRRRALLVGVLRCAALLAMDSNGTSDPFVKLQLRGDPLRRKFKTAIKWRNLNPEFNEEFAFEIKLADLSRRAGALVLTVWDKDLGKANDYLGGLELGFNSKSDRLKHWTDALKFPDRRHERWHNLTASHLSAD